MPIVKMCEVCGVTFLVPLCRDKTATCCSKGCATKRRWQKGTIKNGITAVMRNCFECGKQFKTMGAWVKRGAGKYCSRKCMNRRADLPVEQFIQSYEAGMSLMDISKKFGVAHTMVSRRLKESGVQIRTIEEGLKLAYQRSGGKRRAEGRDRNCEHHHVWEAANGVKLPDGWVVHHKNEKNNDNRPDNLEAMPTAIHTSLHGKLRKIAKANKRIKELEEENINLKLNLTKQRKKTRSGTL